MQLVPPKTLNVLVADDDPVFRSLVEARLMQMNCRILEAADGGQAWQITRAQKLDLALVDFEMPGLDGIALTRCLRSHPTTRHIPIIMCTSRTDTGAMHSALEVGVSTFLTKPVNWSLFEHHIRHLLRLSDTSARTAAAIESIAEKNAEKDVLFNKLQSLLEAFRSGKALDSSGPEAAAIASEYERTAAEMQEIFGEFEPDVQPADQSASVPARLTS